MDRIIRILERISKAKTWKKVVMSLSSVVVFITVYALILPAITVENRTICGFEEHTHGDECYSTVATVICGLEEGEEHTHNESCYSYEKVLTCTLNEHIHLDSCYESVHQAIIDEIKETLNLEDETDTEQEELTLVCTLEHEHTRECYQSKEEQQEAEEELTLVCTLEHEHTEECYKVHDGEDVEEVQEEKVIEEFTIISHLEDGNTVTISGTTEALPEEVEDIHLLTVQATILKNEQVDELMKNITDEESASEKYTLYDISIYYDGKQIEPVGEVQLVITGAVEDPETPVEFFHIDEAHSVKELLDYTVTLDGTITVETDHFSIYGVTNSNATGIPITSLTENRTLDSGTYDLSQDITTAYHFTIASGANVIFNLNGHTITYTGTTTETTGLFTVTGNLTIMDGMETAETVSTVDGEPYNQLATYDRNSGKLTYYITKSDVVNSATGQTVEYLEKHDVIAAGKIVTESGTRAITVNNGGTLTLKSGLITSTSTTARGIYANTGSTLNLEGGYVAGISSSNYGAAVYSRGTDNLTGTVIAANTSSNNGTGIYQYGGTLNISDNGVIAGNLSTAPAIPQTKDDSNGGAGVFATAARITMSGGYVTNNRYICEVRSYGNGGAGFLIKDGTVMNLTGGYITGNYSNCGGGGIRTGRNGGNNTFYMSGGFVNKNIAEQTEGGGIGLDNGAKGYITGGYINNNETRSQEDWGGGGIFIADYGSKSAQLFLYNALITNNAAGGYGGGVAGCSTARITVSITKGCAIYGNSADGEHFSGDESAKHEDTEYAKNQTVFIQNGYDDYFCALHSNVSGGMLGGGTANWTGSTDGVAFSSTSKDDTIYANYIMGANSHPSSTDIQNAQQAAKVYINGNYSYTHGGGILTNGYLFAGKSATNTFPVRFELEGTKELVNESNRTEAISKYIFTFNVTDANGDIVSIGTNAEPGTFPFVGTNTISFDRRIGIDQEGTFDYYISEVKNISNQAGIKYDDTQYLLRIVTKKEVLTTLSDIDNDTITTYQIVAQSATLYKISADGSETQVKRSTLPSTNNDKTYMSQISQERHAVEFTLDSSDTSAFTNVKMNKINYTVFKVWNDGIPGADKIAVDLIKNGQVMDTQELNADNSWIYTWSDLPVLDNSGNAIGYSVKERGVQGYIAQYSYSNGASEGNATIPAGVYWAPISPNETLRVGNTYALIAKDGTHALQITNSSLSPVTVSGKMNGTFTIENATYNTIYPVSAIPNNARWIVDSYTHYTRTSSDLKNVQFDSWLSNDRTDSVLYTTSPESNAGRIRLVNGQLQIEHNSNINDTGSDDRKNYRYIAFENGTFKASESAENSVVLYKQVTISSVNGYTATITNTKVEDVSFKLNIKKVSSENNHQVLKGAKFNLIDPEENTMKFTLGSDGYYTPDENGSEELLISNANGYIRIRELPGGKYTLIEKEAPPGYALAKDQTIDISELSSASGNGTTLEYVVEDDVAISVLPMTGGRGTTILYCVGGLLMAGAAILLIAKKRTEVK